MKNFILICFLVVAALVSAFVIKEVFFFDPTNPYGAKEISPNDLMRLKEQMGDQYPEPMSPEEFAESQMGGRDEIRKPLPDSKALELAIAQFKAYCHEQALYEMDFKVPVEFVDPRFLWVFDFHAKKVSISDVRVTIDKYLRVSSFKIP